MMDEEKVAVRVLKKDRIHGVRIEPGDIRQMPESQVTALEGRGVVVRTSKPLLTNVSTQLANVPEGSRLLVKLPEES